MNQSAGEIGEVIAQVPAHSSQQTLSGGQIGELTVENLTQSNSHAEGSIYTFELPTDSNVIYQIVLPSSSCGQQAVGLSDLVDATQIETHVNSQVLDNNWIQPSGGVIGQVSDVNERNEDVEPVLEQRDGK